MSELSVPAFIDTLCFTLSKIPNRRIYIHEELLPQMDVHRGRDYPASEDEVLRKLFSVDSFKPGEWFEFHHTEEMLEVIESTLGVTLEQARMFCIIKYLTRMQYSDTAIKDRKYIEREVMESFLFFEEFGVIQRRLF